MVRNYYWQYFRKGNDLFGDRDEAWATKNPHGLDIATWMPKKLGPQVECDLIQAANANGLYFLTLQHKQ